MAKLKLDALSFPSLGADGKCSCISTLCHMYVRTGCGSHSECIFMNMSGMFILLFLIRCFLIPQSLATVHTLYPYYLLFLRSCCLHISTSGIKRDSVISPHAICPFPSDFSVLLFSPRLRYVCSVCFYPKLITPGLQHA